MQADLISTFEAYGGCVDQRYDGAKEAAKLGAVGYYCTVYEPALG